MINHLTLDDLPLGVYSTYGDSSKGHGGFRVSGYPVAYTVDAQGIKTENEGIRWVERWFSINLVIPIEERTTKDFYMEFETIMNSIYDRQQNLANYGWNLVLHNQHNSFLKTREYLRESDGASTLRFHVNHTDKTITLTVNGGEFTETLVMTQGWFTNTNPNVLIQMGFSRPSNVRMWFGDALPTVRLENVPLEVIDPVGWYPINDALEPLTDPWDSNDPSSNIMVSALDTDSSVTLRGHLTHPSKQIDIRLTSRASLNDKPIKVTFNGVTKDIIPTGTFKYGELVFQVEDVPAGEFEIIITKEL